VLIIDTAGRLQNRAELMAELEKIVRVLGKHDPDAPHTVLQSVGEQVDDLEPFSASDFAKAIAGVA
jgi:signal recognition particle GTPase